MTKCGRQFLSLPTQLCHFFGTVIMLPAGDTSHLHDAIEV